MERKWGVDEVYDFLFVRRYADLSRWLAEVVEGRFWHDWFHDRVLGRAYREGTRWLSEGFDLPVIDGAANGLANLTRAVSGRLRTLQTGYVRTYALSLLLGVVAVLGILLLR
jgi:NADH:ubiquinone oxidoreductase subunit 5 (subunit L)/multisubunit Na+/H+ antiporter MnhA subunit